MQHYFLNTRSNQHHISITKLTPSNLRLTIITIEKTKIVIFSIYIYIYGFVNMHSICHDDDLGRGVHACMSVNIYTYG